MSSLDQWLKMDQTFLSILPEPRYSPVGGIYTAYEFGDDTKNSLFLTMGRAQYTMYDNMYVYQFTDIRGLTGLWEYGSYSLLLSPIKLDAYFFMYRI